MDQVSQAASGHDAYSFHAPVAHPLKEGGRPPSRIGKLLNRSASMQPTHFFHFPLPNLPDHIREETFDDRVNDIKVRYYISRAPIERGVYTSCAGMKEGITLTPERIAQLHARGISYACLRLMNPGAHRNFMNTYNRYVDFWFLDPESPVHKIFSGVKKFAGGHSTGGLGVLRLAVGPDTSAQMKEHYAQIHADAPFLDTASTSRHDPWWRQIIFTGYSLIGGDSVPEKTYGGNFYLLFSAIKNGKVSLPEGATSALYHATRETMRIMKSVNKHDAQNEKPRIHDSCFQMPTYAQILEIRADARQRIAQLETHGAPQDMAPIHIYADPNDPYSSYKAAAYFKDLTQATLTTANGIHNSHNQDDAAFLRFIEEMEAELPPWPQPETEAAIVSTPPQEQEKGWYVLPPLQRVISYSRERSASLLNTAASLFKNAFGRSVGNAEVRGEPERRAVDTGNALRLE